MIRPQILIANGDGYQLGSSAFGPTALQVTSATAAASTHATAPPVGRQHPVAAALMLAL
jgi:hypothetical protein